MATATADYPATLTREAAQEMAASGNWGFMSYWVGGRGSSTWLVPMRNDTVFDDGATPSFQLCRRGLEYVNRGVR